MALLQRVVLVGLAVMVVSGCASEVPEGEAGDKRMGGESCDTSLSCWGEFSSCRPDWDLISWHEAQFGYLPDGALTCQALGEDGAYCLTFNDCAGGIYGELDCVYGEFRSGGTTDYGKCRPPGKGW